MALFSEIYRLQIPFLTVYLVKKMISDFLREGGGGVRGLGLDRIPTSLLYIDSRVFIMKARNYYFNAACSECLGIIQASYVITLYENCYSYIT